MVQIEGRIENIGDHIQAPIVMTTATALVHSYNDFEGARTYSLLIHCECCWSRQDEKRPSCYRRSTPRQTW